MMRHQPKLAKEVPELVADKFKLTNHVQTPQHRAGRGAKEQETTCCTVPSPPPRPHPPFALKARTMSEATLRVRRASLVGARIRRARASCLARGVCVFVCVFVFVARAWFVDTSNRGRIGWDDDRVARAQKDVSQRHRASIAPPSNNEMRCYSVTPCEQV